MKFKIFDSKIAKVLLIIIGFIFILLLVILLFLKLWIPFGGAPSKEDREDYLKRANNYKDGKFYNEKEFQMIYSNSGENSFVSNKGAVPKETIPSVLPTYLDNPDIDILNITWFGHSTLMIQMHGMNILIDPVFSDKTSPVSFAGPSRFSELPIEVENLPDIDIVVISHDHYDHLDYETIKEIDKKVEKYIVPLGVENHLERWGVDQDKIINLAWWEEIEIDGLLIGCTPARHYSGRKVIDSYNTLWASWVFIDEYYKVFESGDTGFDTHFQEIYDKYGEFDLALLDSGQYDVKWKSTHMAPEEAVEAGSILNAKVIMPIHWGSFKLANHPWDDAVERFVIKAEEENMKYITPKIGETVTYIDNINTLKWWISID